MGPAERVAEAGAGGSVTRWNDPSRSPAVPVADPVANGHEQLGEAGLPGGSFCILAVVVELVGGPPDGREQCLRSLDQDGRVVAGRRMRQEARCEAGDISW